MTTIEKIHNEIDTAQDRLLLEAERIINDHKETDKDVAALNKAERLKRIGFSSAQDVKIADKILEKKTVLVQNKEQADLIRYYKQTYPFLKFITEGELDRICRQYGLIYANSSAYIGEIPEKNINDIENAQHLKPQDVFKPFTLCKYKMVDWAIYKDQYVLNSEIKEWDNPIKVDGVVMEQSKLIAFLANKYKPTKSIGLDTAAFSVIQKDGLFIAAPKSQFNLKGLTKVGLGAFKIFRQEVKDPIVFRYVRGGIQVITKWGLEAEDEGLVNEINN